MAGASFIAVLVACHPAVAPPRSTSFATADAALLRGCYDCLQDARHHYRAAEGDRARRGLFEADLLIALREKELGLPPSDALTEARRLAAQVPPQLEANRYLALVDTITGDVLESSSHTLPLPGARNAALRTWLSHGQLTRIRDYLQISLTCQDAADAGLPLDNLATLPGDAPPLLRYRLASCARDATPTLASLRAGEPRFVEASLFLARTEIAQSPEDLRPAKAHLDEALARFPTSPLATYLTALYYQLARQDTEALQFFDRTLTLRPDHDAALLGRVISLSNLERTADAIAAATLLISHGHHLADAYYWRARNHHALHQLPEARRDINSARELAGTEDILFLAGVIEHEQGNLDLAYDDLTIVANIEARRCEAHWYLGLIDRQRRQWPPAGEAFETAVACYRERARVTAERRQALDARNDLDPAYRARTLASLDAATTADLHQLHQAALIAAGIAATANDLAKAHRLIDLAAEDPALVDNAASLRDAIDRRAHAHSRK